MNTEKFCVDCKWYYYDDIAYENRESYKHRCYKIYQYDKVTGEPKNNYRCYDCRTNEKDYIWDCGPEGKYFEPKVEWKLEDLFKEKK